MTEEKQNTIMKIDSEKNMLLAVAQILNISIDDAKIYKKEIKDKEAIYFWNPIRGGGAVIVAKDGSYLYAVSAINFDEHLKSFLSGERTDYIQ